MNIVKQSLSLLPMEDIAAELKSDKPNRKFMTKEDKAVDVEKVAGIISERIAISAEGHDRQTVNNALNLNGVPADGYITKEDGEKFLNVSTEMSENYSSEIKNLRDELYFLYGELIKKGFIDNTIKYEGFVEGFKKGNKLYTDFVCGISNAMTGRTKDLFISEIKAKHYFEEGKYFVIKRSDTGEEQVVKSLGVNVSGRVSFEPAVNFLDSVDKVGLYKSCGEYANSTFSFSEVKKSVSEQQENYYTQSDDTDTKYLTIKKSNSGYAATFKIARSLRSQKGIAGALSKFSIRAQAINSPGPIRCHVLDYSSIMTNGMLDPKFDSIEDAIEKGYVLASSSTVFADRDNSSMENDIIFDFHGGVHKNYLNRSMSETNTPNGEVDFLSNQLEDPKAVIEYETADNYPIVKDCKYCFIVECLGASEDSYWRIRYSYFNNNDAVEDLQRRNASYVYSAVDSTGVTGNEKAIKLISDINKYDLMYTLVVRNIIEEEEVGKQEGVYTTRIILPKPIDVTRARLTMRINREGMYNVKEHNAEYTIFNLESDTPTSHSSSDTRFKIGDSIIIGNSIAKVKRVSTTEIEVEKPVYLDDRIISYYTRTTYNYETDSYEDKTNIPVYRIGYKPTIKAKLVNWDEYDDVFGNYVSKDISELPLNMELVTVIPDKFKDNTRKSDRLIFEAEFGKENDKNLKANEFELQISWTSPFSAREINEVKDTRDKNFKELIGRIHDLSLSLDKHY